MDSLDAGGPSSAVRWLSEYLETIRAIYAIRIYPEAIVGHGEAEDAVYAVARPCETRSEESASGTAMDSPTKTTA